MHYITFEFFVVGGFGGCLVKSVDAQIYSEAFCIF